MTAAERATIGRSALAAFKRTAKAADAKPVPVPDTSIPREYVAALVELKARKPHEPTDAQWKQAIADAEKFLPQWGRIAHDNGWTARDLFDPPNHGVPPGLRSIKGAPVASLGPHYASYGEGYRVVDKATRLQWQNPYKLDFGKIQ